MTDIVWLVLPQKEIGRHLLLERLPPPSGRPGSEPAETGISITAEERPVHSEQKIGDKHKGYAEMQHTPPRQSMARHSLPGRRHQNRACNVESCNEK